MNGQGISQEQKDLVSYVSCVKRLLRGLKGIDVWDMKYKDDWKLDGEAYGRVVEEANELFASGRYAEMDECRLIDFLARPDVRKLASIVAHATSFERIIKGHKDSGLICAYFLSLIKSRSDWARTSDLWSSGIRVSPYPDDIKKQAPDILELMRERKSSQSEVRVILWLNLHGWKWRWLEYLIDVGRADLLENALDSGCCCFAPDVSAEDVASLALECLENSRRHRKDGMKLAVAVSRRWPGIYYAIYRKYFKAPSVGCILT